jgi:putative heme-binding domain-containing protein
MRLSLAAALLGLLVLSARLPADPPLVATAPPRSPADERAAFRLPPGFEAQLVAAEPDLQKPINLAFDAQGRLWVTCTVEYPYPAPAGKGRDTLKVLEDFGPDGRARKVTTFADGLNIPIGVLPYQDGAIVYSIPNLWRLRDTDGDGRADQRDVLYSGFGTRDTHGMVNGLVLGFDGWLYCCHGFANDSVVRGKDGSEIRMNSGNTFRVRPDGARVEMVCKGQVNPFGQCLDELGNLYTACCHSKPITQLLRGAVYGSFAKPHDGLGFGPDMVHKYNGSTALCGLAYYAADHFPERYRGGLFLGDVVNSRINFFTVERQGGTYTARQGDDFLISDDPWYRPTDIKLGPDGALYVADFYNRIIGHYEVPLDHPGRDRTSGRVWRIVYKGTDGKAAPPKAPRADWTKASVEELVQDLAYPNLTVRLTATHQLVERGQPAVPTVKALLKPETPATPRTHALWVLERLRALDDATLGAAVDDAELAVRVHALRILAERPDLTDDHFRLVRKRLHDDDNLARRVAADVLARHPVKDALLALLELRQQPGTTDDSFLLHTVRMALREQLRSLDVAALPLPNRLELLADAALGLPEAKAADLIAGYLTPLVTRDRGRLPEYAHHVARYGSPNSVQGLGSLYEHQARVDPNLGRVLLLAALRGAQERGGPPPDKFLAWAAEQSSRLLASSKPEEVRNGIELALAARQPVLQGNLILVVIDRQRPEDLRTAALNALATLGARRHIPTLALRLADATESAALREKVAEALAGLNAAEARAALLAALPTAPARLATAIAAGLAGSPQGAEALLQAVADGKASPRLLQERPVQVKLLASKLPNVQERIAKLTEGLPPADANVARLLRGRAAGFAKAQPDAAAGAKVYTQHCAACHQIANQGTKVGPQLDGIGTRGLERLLEDVLDPNRNVDPTFRATTLRLKNGQTVTGLVLREEGQVIVLADAQGKEQRVATDQVELREVAPLSPMPANWAEQVPEKDFHDLMAYLLGQRVDAKP